MSSGTYPILLAPAITQDRDLDSLLESTWVSRQPSDTESYLCSPGGFLFYAQDGINYYPIPWEDSSLVDYPITHVVDIKSKQWMGLKLFISKNQTPKLQCDLRAISLVAVCPKTHSRLHFRLEFRLNCLFCEI